MSVLLGCIGDDFTGSTDLANTLVGRGMRTVQLIGVPQGGDPVPDADAVVIALKSRTNPAQEAVAESLEALRWLRAAGARQFFFKYCSTFDSTDAGNIGPVAEALLDALDAPFSIACPAFPETGRSIYQGHLFVGDRLLSESGMEHHPLTPMTDPDLVRVLARQCRGRVGLVPHATVRGGAAAVAAAFAELQASGHRLAVVDAIDDAHLGVIGEASADLTLVTGGSGVARGLPDNFRRAGLLGEAGAADALPPVAGLEAVLSGSCSRATQGQVAQMKLTRPAFRMDVAAMAEGRDVAAEALAWARERLADGPVLVYSTDDPQGVREVQDRVGGARAGELAEAAMASVARGLVEAGVRRLVVAGGETSGAVVSALGVKALRIGPQIDPGVPWTVSLGKPGIALALKSGNFGTEDFFLKALGALR
jgi:uncharacterized protein YgbK (DUF1537 family)